MDLITSLLLLLISSRLCGRLFKALGFQEIIGDILGGVLIGLTGLVPLPNKELGGIVELAVFLLIFSAGLEMNLKDIFSALKEKALVCAFTGFALPFATGGMLAHFMGLTLIPSLVVGLCFAISALPVVSVFLRDLKIIDTQVGHLIMGSAVLIDIMALLFLGITFNMGETYSALEFIKIFAIKTIKMAFFFITIMMVNKFLHSELSSSHTYKAKVVFDKLISYFGKEATFGIGILFVLGFSALSEALGFHFIIGAFFGGLLLNKDIIGTPAFLSINKTLGAITNHFLTPVFFAHIGLHLSPQAIHNWQMLLAFIFVAFISKIVGSYLGCRLAGLNNQSALQAGIILNSRGVLDLVMANLAHSKGYISTDVFSVLVFLGVFSVMINPVLYRRLISSKDKKPLKKDKT